MTRPETPTLSPCHPTAQHSALSTQQPAVQRADSTDSSSDGRWGFLLFLVVNAALFVRPAEIVPDLLGWQIYLALIVVCLVVAFPSVLRQLTPDMLLNRPITVCVLGILVAIVLSLLSRVLIAEAVQSGCEFVKVVAYYLLLAGLINQPTRLRRFLFCLAIFCVVLTVLALLEYHGAIDLPMRSTIQDRATDADTGEAVFIGRLRGTGIFGDPNDLCLLLVVAILIGLYWLTEPGSGLWRLFWASTLAVVGYAFSLTFSRGGFIALLVGLLVLLRARFGWKKAIVFGVVVLPALFALFAGRQTELSASTTTGQTRIGLWSDALVCFRGAPLLGIGLDRFAQQAGQVAHNSFLHCFAELGFAGGTLFLGAFWIAAWTLYRLSRIAIADPQLRRMQPYMLAVVAAYIAGMMTLSQVYLVPTYMILGLATVFIGLVSGPARIFD